MEKEKIYSLEVAIEAIETFYLNTLHKEKKISMKIKTPPSKNALAWFDPTDDGLYITDDLSKWSPELLYVLPLHENTHKVLYGLVENYENGYHNIAFRDFFEKYSGMRTYHDEKLGWQFIQDVGEKYITWLEKFKNVLNEIFRIIKNTDLPKKENEQSGQEGEQSGQDGGQEGEQDGGNGGQEGESEAEKMNKILRQNSGDQEGESGEQNGEQSDEQKNDQEGESGEQEGEQEGEQSGDTYEGQKQDVVVKGGRKKFRL